MAGDMSAEEDCGTLVSLHSLLLPSHGEWCYIMSPHNDALPGATTMVAVNYGLNHVAP